MWLAATLCLDDLHYTTDVLEYHLPMARLLAMGWNPFSDPQAHGICARLGVDIWGARPYHLAYCSKPAAIFCALAQSFTREPWAVYYPILFLGFVSAAVTLFRTFRSAAILVPFLGLFLLAKLRPEEYWPVDEAMLYASVGLLATMYRDLRENALSGIPLWGYGFWLMNLKLPGVLAAGAFFVTFALVVLWREWFAKKPFYKFVRLAVLLLFASCLASFNPYGTSWRNAGHPLYPFATVDEVNYPVKYLCSDMKQNNRDAQSMGRLGTLFHAYVSPRLAVSYYNWKLKRNDFAPHRMVWDYRNHESAGLANGGTSRKERAIVMLAMLLSFVIPSMRVLAVPLLLLIVFFPFDMIGYLRYQQWIHASFCIAALATVSYAVSRVRVPGNLEKPIYFVVFIWLAMLGVRWANIELSVIKTDWDCISNRPKQMYVRGFFPPEDKADFSSYRDIWCDDFCHIKTATSMNMLLLNKQLGCEKDYHVVCADLNDVKGMEVVKYGWWDYPKPPQNDTRPKWLRVLSRIGNVRYVLKNYVLRIERMF